MLKIQNIQQNCNQEYGHRKAKDELHVSKKMKWYHQTPSNGWIITIYLCLLVLFHKEPIKWFRSFEVQKTLVTCKNLFCFLKDMVLIGVIRKSSSIDCIVSFSTLGYIISNRKHLNKYMKIRMKNITNAILNCKM